MHMIQTIAAVMALSGVGTSAALADMSDTSDTSDIAKRECYTTGDKWGDKRNKALEKVEHACHGSLGERDYTGGKTKSACYNLGKNLHVDLVVQRTIPERGRLLFDECQAYLRREIEGCAQGGHRTYDTWFYR